MATHVERSIEVGVPARTAYDQWTQFEEFPQFMAGVKEVRQVGDAMTHWVADIGGIQREWDAAIVEQVPDEKVAWAATSGATNAGAVYFTPAGPDRTQVRLTLDYEPEGVVERIGDIFDVIDRQAVADLDRFKEYIEREGSASGGWRGTVEEGEVQAGTAGTGGPAADAAETDTTGVAGFGTDTGLSSDDPASGAVTGAPHARTDSEETGRHALSDDGAPNGDTSSAAGHAAVDEDTGLRREQDGSGAVTIDPQSRAGAEDPGRHALTHDAAPAGPTADAATGATAGPTEPDAPRRPNV